MEQKKSASTNPPTSALSSMRQIDHLNNRHCLAARTIHSAEHHSQENHQVAQKIFNNNLTICVSYNPSRSSGSRNGPILRRVTSTSSSEDLFIGNISESRPAVLKLEIATPSNSDDTVASETVAEDEEIDEKRKAEEDEDVITRVPLTPITNKKLGNEKERKRAASSKSRDRKEVTFDTQFKLFAKYGDERRRGLIITKGGSERWLKQAEIVGYDVTALEADTYFRQTAKTQIVLNQQEYKHFLRLLANEKKLKVEKLFQKLTYCGSPNTRRFPRVVAPFYAAMTSKSELPLPDHRSNDQIDLRSLQESLLFAGSCRKRKSVMTRPSNQIPTLP